MRRKVFRGDTVRWVWRIVGLSLSAYGAYLFYLGDLSSFLSGWGVICLGLGTAVLISTWLGGAALALLLAVGVLVTSLVRLLLGTGDWWHWLLLAGMMALVALVGAAAQANDSSQEATSDGETPLRAIDQESRTSERELIERPSPGKGLASGTERVVANLTPRLPGRRSASKQGICSTCGAEINVTRPFCGSCGAAV